MKSVPWLCTNSLFCAVAVASHKLNLEYRPRRPVSPLQTHPLMLSSITHTQARLLSVQQWFEGSRLGSGWRCRPLLVSGRAGACVIRTRQQRRRRCHRRCYRACWRQCHRHCYRARCERRTSNFSYMSVRTCRSFLVELFVTFPWPSESPPPWQAPRQQVTRNPRRSATPPVIQSHLELHCSKTSCRFAGKATNARMVADTKRGPGCNSRVGSKPGGATSSPRGSGR